MCIYNQNLILFNGAFRIIYYLECITIQNQRNVHIIKYSYFGIFVTVLQHNASIIMPSTILLGSNVSNTIHCIHQSIVSYHELNVYSQHVVVIYLCNPFYILISQLYSYTCYVYLNISTKSSDMLNKNTQGAERQGQSEAAAIGLYMRLKALISAKAKNQLTIDRVQRQLAG